MNSTTTSRRQRDSTNYRRDDPHTHQGAAASKEVAGQLAPIIMSARGIQKTYHKGKIAIPVLRGADLDVRAGELMAIVGQSGSGKSTLLHLLATLDMPDAGEVFFEGNRIDNLPAAGRDVLRNRYFGMVFQFYHLLPELSLLENVLMPSMIAHSPWSYWRHRKQLRAQAKDLIERVGLTHRIRHRPKELSGGEMQRASIARALIAQPHILFADEPTGNLDRKAGEAILELLRGLNDENNLTIVIVTHDLSIAQQADRVFRLVEGKVAVS